MSVVCESVCSICILEVTKKGKLEKVKEGAAGLYVGMGWGAARRGDS